MQGFSFIQIFLILGSLFEGVALSGSASPTQGSKDGTMLLIVDKGALTAELKSLPEGNHPSEKIHTFAIAIGKEAGDKIKQGDNRTPEGIYFTLPHIEANKLLTSKYGQRAIPLDFPNQYDLFEGKTGYGIWLHGAGNNERIAQAQATEGCVVFYNEEIMKLKSWLPPDQAVVVIAQDSREVNKPEDVDSVYKQTMGWIEAWQNKDTERYIEHYAPAFHLAGKDLSSYKSYKDKLFHTYHKISIKTTNLRVVTHPKYAVAFMNQDFNGDNYFRSVGRKILYWQKTKEGWQILREVFDKKTFQPLSYSPEDLKFLSSATQQIGHLQGQEPEHKKL